MSLERIYRAAKIRVLEQSLGEVKPIEEQLTEYEASKKRNPGLRNIDWLRRWRQEIKDEELLEKFLQEWQAPKQII